MSASAPEGFWSTLPLGRAVTIVARDDNGLVAFDKPAGVLSHPNEAGDERRSLLQARYVFKGEFFEWGEADERGARGDAGKGRVAPTPLRRLWLLNRLDSATSGVILAAASAELAAEIRAHFKRKQVRKIYSALVFGSPRHDTEPWRDRLAVEKRGGRIRTAAGVVGAAREGHVPAESTMTVVRRNREGEGEPRLTLIRLEPRTGRSHQLRVQCAKRSLPIVGDQTYGDFARNRAFAKATGAKRLFLHSQETEFEYEYRGKRCRFGATAALPEEFEKFL